MIDIDANECDGGILERDFDEFGLERNGSGVPCCVKVYDDLEVRIFKEGILITSLSDLIIASNSFTVFTSRIAPLSCALLNFDTS